MRTRCILGARALAAALAVTLAGAAWLPLAGCKTSQAGVTNMLGTIKTVVESTPDRVIEAAEEAANEMQLEIVSSRKTTIDGRLECQTANEKRVLIKTETAGENVTKLSIKVGSGLGDEALSLRILNVIRENL